MDRSLQEIYTQIWNEHVSETRNYCHAKLKGRPDDADDMLHDAFRLLWEKLINDGVPSNPKAWLLATVKNLAFTEYRHTERDKNNLSSAPFDETVYLPYSADDVAQILEKQELNAELCKALREELSDEERRLIKYEIIDEIPQAQIAELIGKNLSATKTQIFRLKHKLKKIRIEKEKF